MKTRCDSLYARLRPARREELLRLLIEESIPTEKALALCAEWGQPTSGAALSRFIASHAFGWRLDRAKAVAEATANSLPPDYEAKKRRGLAQKEFELAFSDLTTKDLVALKRLQLQEAELQLDFDKFQFDAAKACLAHLPALREIAQDSGMDDAAKLQAVRKRLFGDLPAEALAKAGVPA